MSLPLAILVARGDYLWWTVVDDPPVEIHNQTTGDLEDTLSTRDFTAYKNGQWVNVTDLRVHVVGNGADEYLNITASAGLTGTALNFVGALPISGLEWPDYVWAFDVSPYFENGELKDGYHFYVEIGNWTNYDDPNSWTVMADNYIPDDEIASHVAKDMVTPPTGYDYEVRGFISVVPEPTSGLLMLFGIGFLALRRKRRTV